MIYWPAVNVIYSPCGECLVTLGTGERDFSTQPPWAALVEMTDVCAMEKYCVWGIRIKGTNVEAMDCNTTGTVPMVPQRVTTGDSPHGNTRLQFGCCD